MGFRPFIRLGVIIAAVAALALAFFLEGDRRRVAQVAMFAFGVGLGFANTALLIGAQVAVPWSQRGIVTAMVMFCRTIGGTLAVGALGGYLSARLGPQAAEINRIIVGHGRASAAIVGPLEEGLHVTFWMCAAFAVAAALVALWYPRQEA
jgi:MFS family permease